MKLELYVNGKNKERKPEIIYRDVLIEKKKQSAQRSLSDECFMFRSVFSPNVITLMHKG